jgi:hypothetical protein
MNRWINKCFLILVLALPLLLCGCENEGSQRVTITVYKAGGDGSMVVKVESFFPSTTSRKDAIRQVIAALELQSQNEVPAEKR